MSRPIVAPVEALWRYPIKSMRGERVDRLELEARGVVGDRRFAVADADGKLGSGKDTRRFRNVPGLLELASRYDGAVPVITLPDGRELRGDDSDVHAALSDVLGMPVTLAEEAEIPHLDAGPVHIVTTGALAALGQRIEQGPVDPSRFRPNLIVRSDDDPRDWAGRELHVRDVVLRVDRPTERCRMVAMAQGSLAKNPAVQRELVQNAANQFGVYADVVTPGSLEVGYRLVARSNRAADRPARRDGLANFSPPGPRTRTSRPPAP